MLLVQAVHFTSLAAGRRCPDFELSYALTSLTGDSLNSSVTDFFTSFSVH